MLALALVPGGMEWGFARMGHRWKCAFNNLNRSGGWVEGCDPDGECQPMDRIACGKSGSAQKHGSLMNRLVISPTAFNKTIAVLLGVVLVFGPVASPVYAKKDESAKKLYAIGQAAEAREDFDAAFDAFKKAYAKAPTDLRMRTAYYRVRQTASSAHVTDGRKMAANGNEDGALAQFMRAAEIDPGNESAIQEITHIRAHQSPAPVRNETSVSDSDMSGMEDAGAPVQLKPVSNDPLTLHFSSEDSKNVYQAIGKAAGINVLFDPDYNGKHIQVDLTNVSLMDALRIIGTLSTTFWRPVTENTIFVAANTRAKRTEMDDQAVQTFYLSNAWQQNDLNDVQTAIRNVLPNTKVYGVPSQNAIVMRATSDELTMAQKIINDLDKARPEVVVDVAIMEVDKDKLRNIGLSWPGSIGFALQPPQSTTNTTTTTNTDGTTSTSTGQLTLNNLANLNANNFAITVSAATANLLMTDSDTKILQNPRIRATDGQKATMKIGQKIPIATGSYQTGAATAITSSLVNTQFQFQDVGVQVEMTPTVHFDHDVTLKLKIEDSSVSGSSTISGVTEPIIAQKTSEQTIRLREGEASILSGILNKQDIVSLTGIPGLGELPLLRYVFGSKSHEVIDDEVVFVLVPHIVRGQDITPLNLRRIDTGAGTAIDLRHTSLNLPKPNAGSASGTPQGGSPQGAQGVQNRPVPGFGPLKGQTAAAAVKSAMAQLREENAADIPSANAPATPAAPPTPVNFMLTPPATIPGVGANFQVAVNLNGGKDISSVPLQIQYDASKMSLVNVDSGDLLARDGQAVALVHRDDGPGMITVAISRPPGTAGVTGSGSVCVLTFQAKQSGESDVVITRPGALDSAQRPVAASAQNAHIVVH
jgi:general secretion pathway protein D